MMKTSRWATHVAACALVSACHIASLTAQAPDPELAAEQQPPRDAFSGAYVEGRLGDMAAAYTPEAVLLPSGEVAMDARQRPTTRWARRSLPGALALTLVFVACEWTSLEPSSRGNS